MTDETKKKVDKIMEYCQLQSGIYNNLQQSTKIIINGIYGSFGFDKFYFYNPALAESVTKQGKDAILNAERLMNLWAKKVWTRDEKTHRKMGVKLKPDSRIEKDITIYIDTDSCHSSTILNLSNDVIRINGKIYNQNDDVKIMRGNTEMVVKASDIKYTDFIWED